jgi:hypothetical protein
MLIIRLADSTETKTATSRTPSHFAYNVRNREGGDNFRRRQGYGGQVWIRIGSAWAHADGKRFKSLIENYEAFLR